MSTMANGKCNDGIVLDRGKEVGFFSLTVVAVGVGHASRHAYITLPHSQHAYTV